MILNGIRYALVMINRIRAILRLNLNINNIDVRACNDIRRLQVILANLLAQRRLFRA